MQRTETPEPAPMVRQRKERRPIATTDVLTASARPGYVRRFVNDSPGRVQRFIDAGYEPVRDPSANRSEFGGTSALGDSVIRQDVGSGKTAVLMEIPQEWYDEDQAKKQERVDSLENGLRRNIGPYADHNGQYGTVKIGE